MEQVSNWGNYPRLKSNVIKPSTEKEIAATLKNIQSLIPRGNGRSYGDNSLAQNILSTKRLNHFLFFDERRGILEAESGVLLDEISDCCLKKGWFLFVTPGTQYVTLGGAIASDVHGKNHHCEGSFSNYLISMQLMTAQGKVITVSPNQHQELFNASCGGMGLTGIIISAKIQLKKVQSAYISQTTYPAKNLLEVMNLFKNHHSDTYTMAWIDCLAKGKKLGRSILVTGEHAGAKECQSKYPDPFFLKQTIKKLKIPFYFPSWVLNRYFIKLFNSIVYHVQTLKSSKYLISLHSFFYPLDHIKDWNKMYGKRGFYQYQCLIPYENSEKALTEILTHISKKGCASFLAILKLFGPSNPSLSFPAKGYTLALDFPRNNKSEKTMNELDKIIEAYGGRIYLAKDARINKDSFSKGYKNLDEFIKEKRKWDPENKFESIQSKRLGIR